MLKAGFARVDVTPPLGSDLSGYFYRRLATGTKDPLYVNAVAIENDEEKIILIAIDYIGIKLNYNMKIRKMIEERTGVPVDHVLLAALHQHTAPCIGDEVDKFTALRDPIFQDVLFRKIADAAVMAVADLQEAVMSTAEREVEEPIAFVRRYFTADGSVQTNPDTKKYTLTKRCAEADNTMRLIRFTREKANDIAILNFSTHPDVVTGMEFSADWPGFTRKYFEEDVPGVSSLFFTGCQGDSNHFDFFKPKEERLKNNCGYDHAKYMGRIVANAAKAAWGETKECAQQGIFAENTVLYNKTNVEDVDQYDHYKAWYDDYEAGRLDYNPHITELAYASRIIRLRTAPIFHPVPLTVMGIGGVAFVGFGGEAFTAYGAAMRALVPEKFVVCAVCANGYEGYFPTEEAFGQGGYEAKSSLFTPTLEKEIVAAADEIFKKHR
ncbi:MAG: hypothetical protein E7329_01235 [Clostridiales bacterium]|nr:hypothetical protein [Clostridiales bacterium]